MSFPRGRNGWSDANAGLTGKELQLVGSHRVPTGHVGLVSLSAGEGCSNWANA